MKLKFTNNMIFGFTGPNLCLLGNEQDFRRLAGDVVGLTGGIDSAAIDLLRLDYIENVGEGLQVMFTTEKGAREAGCFDEAGALIFRLDSNFWERFFKYFVLMSWSKCTYYLNSYENCLADLDLKQDCHFICSSEF
ncbi:hypothetical protein ACQKLP_12920 [Chitinophaga sp. NPDC101104]|uniref:hypothetical protein n=1 Tax=Chitinophaga sp. NPDC101104 TaxID=3390561 RepID=UPI003D076091